MRTWISKSGDSVDAQLTKTSKYQVILQTAKGKQIKIRKSQLSQQDLRYLDKLSAIQEFEDTLRNNAIKLQGNIQQMIDNDIVLSRPQRITISLIQDPNDKVKRMQPTMIEKKELLPVTQGGIPVIVLKARRNTDSDGAKWSGTVYPCGVKTLEIARRKNIYKCFSVSLRQAKRMLLETLSEDDNGAEAIRELTAPMRTSTATPVRPNKLRMK
ncbi:MAG: hypothetical protein KAI74_06340 [Kiritimatiellae bacterium]|nr:hypothetical protein [Kiritimatiellia bacterium]